MFAKKVPFLQEKYLLIVPTNSKTTVRDSASMETAAVVYERILARNDELGLAGRDDYLFFPQYKNRAYALATIVVSLST